MAPANVPEGRERQGEDTRLLRALYRLKHV
jgi:hypothetical protein